MINVVKLVVMKKYGRCCLGLAALLGMMGGNAHAQGNQTIELDLGFGCDSASVSE